MVELRGAKIEDLPFIYSTWLRSYRYASQFAKKISNSVFYEWHHKVIDRFIERGGKIFIAHAPGEPEVILGYLCLEGDLSTIQYIYVKKAFRKMGIAKELFNTTGASSAKGFTHWTLDTNWIIKKLDTLTYNPYLL